MFQPSPLLNRTALVTGASRGIGLAVARSLAATGASQVTLVARDAGGTALDKAAAQITNEFPKTNTVIRRGDVSEKRFAQAVVNEAKADILVNAAGISQRSLFLRTSEDDISKVLETNLHATIWTCQAFARDAIRRGLKRKGDGASNGEKTEQGLRGNQNDVCIINVGSLLGSKGGAGASVYAASKAGVLALTRALAAELGPAGVRVNAVVPGYIDTDMTADMSVEQRAALLSSIPQRRFGSSEEVASAVVFLAANTYANNCVLNIDGGLSAV